MNKLRLLLLTTVLFVGICQAQIDPNSYTFCGGNHQLHASIKNKKYYLQVDARAAVEVGGIDLKGDALVKKYREKLKEEIKAICPNLTGPAEIAFTLEAFPPRAVERLTTQQDLLPRALTPLDGIVSHIGVGKHLFLGVTADANGKSIISLFDSSRVAAPREVMKWNAANGLYEINKQIFSTLLEASYLSTLETLLESNNRDPIPRLFLAYTAGVDYELIQSVDGKTGIVVCSIAVAVGDTLVTKEEPITLTVGAGADAIKRKARKIKNTSPQPATNAVAAHALTLKVEATKENAENDEKAADDKDDKAANAKDVDGKNADGKDPDPKDDSSTSLSGNVTRIASEKDFAFYVQLQGSEIPLTDCGITAPQNQNNWTRAESPKVPTIAIDSVTIRVFNNTFHQIDIVGRIDGKAVQTVSNINYGLNARTFIDGGSTITLENSTYTLCFRNLFFIRPADSDGISYNIADGVYRLFPGGKKNGTYVSKKRLLDYISLSAFLDLQSMGQSSSNKNFLTDLYFNYPVNSINHGNGTWFKYFYLNASLGLDLFSNKTDKPNAFYRPDSVFLPRSGGQDTFYSPAYYFKNFDLIRNSFLTVKPVMNLLSFDIKKANTLIEFNVGASLMGSNMKYVDPKAGDDSATSSSLYSLGYLFEGRLRFNPTSTFGVDLHASINTGQSPLNGTFKSITGDYNTETLVKANMLDRNRRGFFQGELNLFFNPRKATSDTDRGGFFVKLNVFRATHYPDGFFMLLAGYSSDIKNFFR